MKAVNVVWIPTSYCLPGCNCGGTITVTVVMPCAVKRRKGK